MRVDRRHFLVSAGSVAAALGAVALPIGDATAADKTVYSLDPEWGAGDPDCEPDPHDAGLGCHACGACHGHSVKLFTTPRNADRSRAHPHCKCFIKTQTVSERDYVSFFGPPSGPLHRDEYDPRKDKPFLPSAPGLNKDTIPAGTGR